MQRGSNGDDVRKLQRALMELGYDLPRWGDDGDLGVETMEAFALFLRAHGAAADDDADVISDAEIALLQQVVLATRGAALGPKLPGGRFVDLRTAAAQVHVGGRRSWKQIRGITLHQTACMLGEKPARWGTLGAHLGVTRAGQVIWLHDFDKIVWHAQLFNKFTIGIELEGTYAGVEGDEKTFWRPSHDSKLLPQTPTSALVTAAMETVRWICTEVAGHGGQVELLLAHRQSSGQRQADPGSALWRQVAMPLHTELDLTDGGASYALGSGRSIPEVWNESRKGVRY